MSDRKLKYSYRLVIQGNFGTGWEDMCDYDKSEISDCLHDLKEYRLSGVGTYRKITRRVTNE